MSSRAGDDKRHVTPPQKKNPNPTDAHLLLLFRLRHAALHRPAHATTLLGHAASRFAAAAMHSRPPWRRVGQQTRILCLRLGWRQPSAVLPGLPLGAPAAVEKTWLGGGAWTLSGLLVQAVEAQQLRVAQRATGGGGAHVCRRRCKRCQRRRRSKLIVELILCCCTSIRCC